jgi:hypothetical protein
MPSSRNRSAAAAGSRFRPARIVASTAWLRSASRVMPKAVGPPSFSRCRTASADDQLSGNGSSGTRISMPTVIPARRCPPGAATGRIVHRVLTDRVIGVDPVPRRARDQRARDTPQRRGRSACRSSRRSPRAWPTHGRAGDPRGARASGEAVPCGGSGSAKDQVAVVRGAALRAACFAGAFAAPHFPRLYPAGVSFKPKPRTMLSRFAFPRSAVKEFKRPSKVVEAAGHFKS